MYKTDDDKVGEIDPWRFTESVFLKEERINLKMYYHD